MHRLSIIIPHYNSAGNLKLLLDSVLNECEDTQIIVVDDNSSEDLDIYDQLVNEYLDRVVFLKNDTGIKGAGSARNVGLSASDGEWILFSDSDDHFVPGWYGIVNEYFDKDYDIVYFNPTSRNISTQEAGKRHLAYSEYVASYVNSGGDYESDHFLRYFYIVPWSKLIRGSMLRDKNISFDEVRYSNDVMFSVKSGFHAKKITADTRTIYCVAEGENSLTKDMSEEAWGIRQEVYCKRNLFLREHLEKEDYSFFRMRIGSFGRLYVAIRRKCGIRNFIKYCRMYRKYKVPTVYSALYSIYKFFKLLRTGRLRDHAKHW